MEGLHHDTNLDEEKPSSEPNDIATKNEPAGQEVKEVAGEEGFANKPVNQNLPPDSKISLYEQMVRIRRFEERSLRAYQQGHIGGFLHLYIGQEAVAVGCA